MVNGSKYLDLMLGSQKPYLNKIGLGFEKGDDEPSSKDFSYQIPACIYYFKKGHYSERCFSKRKAKQKVKKPKNFTNTKDLRRYGYLKLKFLPMQVCLKSIHQREKKWYPDSGCSRHMTGNKS